MASITITPTTSLVAAGTLAHFTIDVALEQLPTEHDAHANSVEFHQWVRDTPSGIVGVGPAVSVTRVAENRNTWNMTVQTEKGNPHGVYPFELKVVVAMRIFVEQAGRPGYWTKLEPQDIYVVGTLIIGGHWPRITGIFVAPIVE